jgi:hypothetical protein
MARDISRNAIAAPMESGMGEGLGNKSADRPSQSAKVRKKRRLELPCFSNNNLVLDFRV